MEMIDAYSCRQVKISYGFGEFNNPRSDLKQSLTKTRLLLYELYYRDKEILHRNWMQMLGIFKATLEESFMLKYACPSIPISKVSARCELLQWVWSFARNISLMEETAN